MTAQALRFALATVFVACGRPTGADGESFDAPQDSGVASFARYVGSHSGSKTNPISGITANVGRSYQLALDSSAQYVIVNPVEPSDQLDWNKLPGFSDCGTLDVAKNGAMFGWRWRIDLDPAVLEITAYANYQGQHRWTEPALLQLTASELAAATPLTYAVVVDDSHYSFAISGEIAGRTIDLHASQQRACSSADEATLHWASGLYFGGTSTAPSPIVGLMLERAL
jgi:hypothetical protein